MKKIIILKKKPIIAFIVMLLINPYFLITNERGIGFSIDKEKPDMINIPQLPQASNIYYEDTTGTANGVFISGNYAYVADGDSGLAIIDISNPANPGTPVYEDTTGTANGVFISRKYA